VGEGLGVLVAVTAIVAVGSGVPVGIDCDVAQAVEIKMNAKMKSNMGNRCFRFTLPP
jgi:hypothetical protein